MHDQQKFHTDAVEKNSNKNKYDTSNRKHNNDGFNPIIQQPDDDPLNTRKSIGKQNLSGSVRKHHHNHHRRKKTLAHDRQKSIIDNGLTYEVQATSSNNRSVPVYSRKNSSNALNDNNPTKHKEFSGLKVITSKVQLPPLPLSSQSFIPSASPQIFGLHTFGSPIPFKQDNNNMNNSLREGSISSQNVPPHSPDNIPFSNPFSSRSVNFQRQASPGGFPASPTPSAGGMTVYDGSVGGVFPPPFSSGRDSLTFPGITQTHPINEGAPSTSHLYNPVLPPVSYQQGAPGLLMSAPSPLSTHQVTPHHSSLSLHVNARPSQLQSNSSARIFVTPIEINTPLSASIRQQSHPLASPTLTPSASATAGPILSGNLSAGSFGGIFRSQKTLKIDTLSAGAGKGALKTSEVFSPNTVCIREGYPESHRSLEVEEEEGHVGLVSGDEYDINEDEHSYNFDNVHHRHGHNGDDDDDNSFCSSCIGEEDEDYDTDELDGDDDDGDEDDVGESSIQTSLRINSAD